MKAQIAYDKKRGLHYIVRLVPIEQVKTDSFMSSLEDINNLLGIKTQGQFLRLIDELPPLLPLNNLFDLKRIFPIKEVMKESFEYAFVDCRPEELAVEFHLDSALELRSNNGLMRTFIREYGTNEKKIKKELTYVNQDACVFLVEPVYDWTCVRNIISISARVMGYLEKGSERPLEEAGFVASRSKILKKDMFVIPYIGNPFFTKRKATKESVNLHAFHFENKNPFFNVLFNNEVKTEIKIPLYDYLFIPVRSATKDSNVFVTSMPLATGVLESLGQTVDIPEVEKPLYLCVEQSGTQVEMAKMIISSLSEGFRKLTVSNKKMVTSLGWEYDSIGEWENLSQARLKCCSLASALWYRLVYHQGKRLAVCVFCGNAVLSNERGVRRAYCNTSCRVRDAKRRKEGEADE